MDALTFISKIVAALAWPLAAVVLAAMFWKPIDQLLRRLTAFRMKVGNKRIVARLARIRRDIKPPSLPDTNLGFQHSIAQPARGKRHLKSETPHYSEVRVEPVAPTGLDRLEKLWTDLNRELRKKAKAAAVEQSRDSKRIASALMAEGLLAPDFERYYAFLNRVRLSARRKPALADAALIGEFRDVCDLLMEHLRQIGD